MTNTNKCFILIKTEHLFLDEKETFMEKDEKLKALDAALSQIEKREYAAQLLARGIPKERIRGYGFAFCGKKVMIGTVRTV